MRCAFGAVKSAFFHKILSLVHTGFRAVEENSHSASLRIMDGRAGSNRLLQFDQGYTIPYKIGVKMRVIGVKIL